MAGAAYFMRQSEVAEAIGPEAADRLVSTLGGTKFYVPKKLKDGHLLADVIGKEMADKFAAFVSTGRGGLLIELPIGNGSHSKIVAQRLRELVERDDMTGDEIAVAIGVTVRTVRRARARLRAERAA